MGDLKAPEYTPEALAAVHIDFLDAKASAWMDDTGVRNMFNAIASVFEKWASQEIMDRFREKLKAIGHQCFVEGALRAWTEIQDERAASPPPPIAGVTREERQHLLEEGFRLGFAARGEGYNGEYPDEDFANDKQWLAMRDRELTETLTRIQPNE